MPRPPASLPPTAAYYPPSAFHFSIQIADAKGGLAASQARLDTGFQDVSGLTAEIDAESYAEGGVNGYRHRLPTATKYPDLVLRRGFVAKSQPLYAWCEQSLQDGFAARIQPRMLILQLLAPDPKTSDNAAIRQWDFYGAWPIKWSLADFNSTSHEVVIETLAFAYRYFKAS